jgi:hypothetical protein
LIGWHTLYSYLLNQLEQIGNEPVFYFVIVKPVAHHKWSPSHALMAAMMNYINYLFFFA